MDFENDYCQCGGCRISRETGFDCECHVTLEYEEIRRWEEECVDTVSTMATREFEKQLLT